jgi:ribosomal protein S18 acetylase RimI-like enzyme
MKPHPLDNPVWSSLCSRHIDLAQIRGSAGRYPADVAPFVAIDPTLPIVSDDLEALVAPAESVLFVGPAPRLPPPWQVDVPVQIAQMTCTNAIAAGDDAGPEIVELSTAQVHDMLTLTALVYPHYFRPRTIAMGRYIGIYEGDRLIAMAGERMGMDRYQEISAVCTHPEFLGRGFAQRLVARINNDAIAQGRQPFLHVSHQNTRAVALYQRLGYAWRADLPLTSVTRIA